MAKPKINLLPDTLDLAFYAGDGANIQLTVTNVDETPVAVAGEVVAQVRPNKLSETVTAEFAVDLTNGVMGVVVLSLTGEQTTAMLGPSRQTLFKGLWDVQWNPEGQEPITLIQGRVECYADVSR